MVPELYMGTIILQTYIRMARQLDIDIVKRPGIKVSREFIARL